MGSFIGAAEGRSKPGSDTARALLLSAGLAFDARPAHAAALLGIDYRDEAHLTALASEAELLGDAGNSGVAARRVNAVINLLSVRLALKSGQVPPSVLSSAMKSAAATATLLTGGARPTYSNIVFVVRGPAGESVRLGDEGQAG